MQELCENYDLEYNTGPLHKQLGSVAAKIFRLALPPRAKDRCDGDGAGTPEQVTGFPRGLACATASRSHRVATDRRRSTDRTAELVSA